MFGSDEDFGIGKEDRYQYMIKLTEEQAALVEHREMGFLVVDGVSIFKLKNEHGEYTGEKAIFVTFK